MTPSQLDQLCINTLRFLAVDAVEQAGSGHPGLPLGAAPMAYVLWDRFLRFDPAAPKLPDRDRFVLSAGHGSALLYALLHVYGYDLPREQLERFRQWGSVTAGHPESELVPGIEASTGPLGQGVGNALGMAMAEAHLGAVYNRPGHEIFRHFTYVLASDGDMMEGVQSEACSLAGHLRLGRLIVLFDNNHVTLSGTTDIVIDDEEIVGRYRACGWHVQEVADGNDLAAIDTAIRLAQQATAQPSLICVRTILGYGAPEKQGTYEAHGSPLGADEVKRAKENLGWPGDSRFYVPEEAEKHFQSARERGRGLSEDWRRRMEAYARDFPTLAREIERRFAGALPEGWAEGLPAFAADKKGTATRKASHAVMQTLAARLPELVGGSGDLDPSTFSALQGYGDFEAPAPTLGDAQGLAGGAWGYAGRNFHFGVREHAMAAAVNGLVYHGGFIPYAATFLVFSDYMRPAIRLAALARLHSIFIFTHDSIGLGEDGPSHQPIEQLASLRAIPHLVDLRPADANETRCAWQLAVAEHRRPTALVLTRQNVPTLDRSLYAPAEGLRHGAYVLKREEEPRGSGAGTPSATAGEPDLILIASGSEVALIVAAEPILRQRGVRVRLVSMPSWRLFGEQSAEYRESVLPARVTARVAVEAGATLGWERWVGAHGAVIGIDRFGASAPGLVAMEKLGFTVDRVVEQAQEVLRAVREQR